MNDDNELENLEADGIVQEDIEEAKINPPKKPDFPFLIFMLVAFTDIGGFVGGILTLGFAGTILNFITAPILFFYLSGKVGFVKKRLYRKYIFATVVKIVPGINFIPQNTIFVVRGYMSEIEQVDKILSYLENLPKKI